MGDKPSQVFRIGSIKASIWVQHSESGHPYSVTKLVRVYKDKNNDEWKETNTFSADDLPKLELAAQKAFEFSHTEMHEKEKTGEHKNEEQEASAPAKKRGQRKSHVEKLAEERAATGKGK